MSLNRLSYLESWVQNPASFRRRPREQSPGDESDDDELAYHDLPDASLSSFFPSTYSHPSLRRRLNFNPYAGPGWNEPVDEANADRISVQREAPDVPAQDPETQPERTAPVPQAKPQDWDGLETTGAFEVGRTRRVCKLSLACTAAQANINSASLYCGDLLLLLGRRRLWIRRDQTGFPQRRRLSRPVLHRRAGRGAGSLLRTGNSVRSLDFWTDSADQTA